MNFLSTRSSSNNSTLYIDNFYVLSVSNQSKFLLNSFRRRRTQKAKPTSRVYVPYNQSFQLQLVFVY